MFGFLLSKYLLFKGAAKPIKFSALITVLGIALATAVLIISVSVAGGFEESYKRSILDFNAHIIMLKGDGEISNYKNLLTELPEFEGVKGISPFIYRETMAVSNGVVKGIVVKGVDFEKLKSVSRMAISTFNGLSPDGLILGKALAANLKINGPSTIKIVTGKNEYKELPVSGIFESGLYDYDSQFALAPLDKVQKLYAMTGKISGVEISMHDPEDALIFSDVLKEHYPFPYEISNWAELNAPIFEAVKLEKIAFAIIVGMLALVSTFNIIGTIVLRVIYKMKDISILQALGLRRKKLRELFTFQGLMLGSAGALLGVVIAVLFMTLISKYKLISIEPEVYFLSYLPVKFDGYVFSIVPLLVILVSYLTSSVASWRGVSVNPSEGMK